MSDPECVWIKTQPSPDGTTYVVTLEAGPDVARILTPDAALKYAAAVLAAAERATYDASVLKQLETKLDLPREVVAQVVIDMRKDRPSLNTVTTHPLAFEPGVNEAGEPFLVVSVHGRRVGQWTPADAYGHAMEVLSTVSVADLDSIYFRTMTNLVGLDENRARQVVGGLQDFR